MRAKYIYTMISKNVFIFKVDTSDNTYRITILKILKNEINHTHVTLAPPAAAFGRTGCRTVRKLT